MSSLVHTTTAGLQARDLPAHVAAAEQVADRLATGPEGLAAAEATGRLTVVAVNEVHKWRRRRRDARPTPLRHPNRFRSETP
jgi:hypothetical protein